MKRHRHTVCASSVRETIKVCSEHYTHSTSAPSAICAMSKVTFKLHPPMLQHVTANCCNSSLDSLLTILNAGHKHIKFTDVISGDPGGHEMGPEQSIHQFWKC